MTRRDQLRDWLDTAPHRPDEVTRVARAVCAALASRHESTGKPVYLAPARVTLLQTNDGRATALFEGIESFEEQQVQAPEGARGQVGAPSDLYAVGVVLYEALTGKRPGRNGAPSEPSAAAPGQGIPPALDRLVVSLLAVDPAQRPTAQGAIAALDEVGEETTTEPSVREEVAAASAAPVAELVEGPSGAATAAQVKGKERPARKTGESDFSMSFFAFGEKLAAEERTAYEAQVGEDLRRERNKKRLIAAVAGVTLVSAVVAFVLMRRRDAEEQDAVRAAAEKVESLAAPGTLPDTLPPPPTPTLPAAAPYVSPTPGEPVDTPIPTRDPTATPTPTPDPTATPTSTPTADPTPAPEPKSVAKPKPRPRPVAKRKPPAKKPAPKPKARPAAAKPVAKPKPSGDPTPDWAK